VPQEFDVVCLGGGVAGEAIAAGLQGSGLTLAEQRFAAAGFVFDPVVNRVLAIGLEDGFRSSTHGVSFPAR
jgi:2-polyprenyl-6-methoxyphenol hydroxylase-like FAD-dependent oxidoreductase